jgi:hypothetical protein
MSYEVKIIADSVSPAGARITTYQLRYPRMIHAEFMTHRAISRNASSTRAIPMGKQIQSVMDDPAMPVYWGKNQKGMQATVELTKDECAWAERDWLIGRDQAVHVAKSMMMIGIHKQIAGRIIEPWSHISVVATATSAGWSNFFSLRCDRQAMPEIQALAVPMARDYRDSRPFELKPGMLHLPYITAEELDSVRQECGNYSFGQSQLVKCSVARCARVSYLTHDGESPNVEKDIELHDFLMGNGHWSPFEHQAYPHPEVKNRSGNLVGWIQYRQLLPKSVHNTFDFSTLGQFGDRDFIV